METNTGLTIKERFAGSGSTPVPQMPTDTGTGCTGKTNSSIKFNACVNGSGEAVSMEHLPAPPLCLYQKNQSHRVFFLWDAQLRLTVLLQNYIEVKLGSFTQNKLQETRDRDEVYS